MSPFPFQTRLFNKGLGLTFLLIAVCGGLIGCNGTQDVETSQDKSKGADLPKMKFHKPANFSTAVSRLSEIMTVIQSDFSLPAAKKFKVLEVIHGTGSSAHSHYYLADSKERDDDHDHDHEDMESSERIHEIEIEILTELKDIIRWLPKIAGDTDMERTSWDQVNEISKSLDKLIADVGQGLDDEELRKAIKTEEKSFNELVIRLKTLADGLNANAE